jgi:hypothetical protein
MNCLLQYLLAAYYISDSCFKHLTCYSSNVWHYCQLYWLYTTCDDPHIQCQRNKSHYSSLLKQTTSYYRWGGSKVLKFWEENCSYKSYMRFKVHMLANIYIMGCNLLHCENGNYTVYWNIWWTLKHDAGKHWNLKSFMSYRQQ